MNMRRRWTFFVLVMTMWSGAACDDSAEMERPADEVRSELDAPQEVVRFKRRVELEEPDTAYVGRPVSVLVHATGIWITDGFGKRLMRFASDGALSAIYGREGEGPGEFRLPGVAIAVADSVVLVADDGGRSVEVFDLASREWLEEIPINGALGRVSEAAGIFSAGVMSLTSPAALLQWRGRRIDEAVEMGHYPQGYKETGPLAGTYNRTVAFPHGAAVAYLPQGSDLGYLVEAGVVADSFEVPVRHRQGAPRTLPETLRSVSNLSELLASASGLIGGAALTSGKIALVHQDQAVREGGGPREARSFVSVLEPDAVSATCIDIPLPALSKSPPKVALLGDTLFVLEITIDTAGDAKTVLTAFEIDDDDC